MMQTTSPTVSISVSPHPVSSRFRHRLRTAILAVGLSVAAAVPTGLASTVPAHAASFDAAAAEAQLVAATNADRAAAGLPALVANPTLGAIARSAPINICGSTVNGRSQDMIDRGYFSHQVPPCGGYVWPALAAAGVQVSAAAENIGWNNTAPQGSSADQVNSAFMNSPGHKANIMGAFNQVGIGAVMAPGAWSSNGSTYYGVIMYTEIFAMAPLPVPPPPTASSVDGIGVVGTDNQLWARQGTDGYSPLGGILLAAPAAVRMPSVAGGIVYIGTGADHDLWVRSAVLGWQRLNSGGAVNCLDNPVVVIIGGTIHVACEGGDRALWYATGVVSSGLPAVGGWRSLGGVLASGPAAGQLPGASGPTFLVEGTDGAVWSRDLYNDWRSTGWRCIGHPALAGNGTGTAYFACHGADGQLWDATNAGGGWSSATPRGGVLVDGTAVSLTAAGANYYGEGTDGHVWETSIVNGQGTGWVLVGGNVRYGVGSAA